MRLGDRDEKLAGTVRLLHAAMLYAAVSCNQRSSSEASLDIIEKTS